MSATRTDQPDIEILRAALTGDVHVPGTPGYAPAGQAWNLTVHQRPALVVEAADARDVAMAIDHARRHGLRVAPRAPAGAASLGDLSGTFCCAPAACAPSRSTPWPAGPGSAPARCGTRWSSPAGEPA